MIVADACSRSVGGMAASLSIEFGRPRDKGPRGQRGCMRVARLVGRAPVVVTWYYQLVPTGGFIPGSSQLDFDRSRAGEAIRLELPIFRRVCRSRLIVADHLSGPYAPLAASGVQVHRQVSTAVVSTKLAKVGSLTLSLVRVSGQC